MKTKNKLKLWGLFLIALSITAYLINDTYAIFETNASADKSLEIGKWVIKLNNTNISTGVSQSFIVDNFVYTENSHIKDGFIAPGRSGYFDVVLDPSGTDTAVRFDITFDQNAVFLENINFSISTDDTDIIMTGPRTYSGIFDLEQIEDEDTANIRINIIWNDMSTYDSSDTELGIIHGNNISIPVNVYVVQYLGEELVEYTEESEL